MGRKIILFELNEVPYRVIDLFVRENPASTLARILPRCRQYETRAEDRVLSPWVTWPTLHRGVTDGQHHIQHFGEDLREADGLYPPVWTQLTRAGVRTGVFASLHSYPMPADFSRYAFYVPDPFATGSETFPASLSAFQAFNVAMSRESARNVSTGVPVGLALEVLRGAPRMGLRAMTLADVARQLVAERLNAWRRVRRRTYQTVLAFDIFLKQLRGTKPDFATFFTNHVASAMHRYWAATFPEDYEAYGFDDGWRRRFDQEIRFAMSRTDRFLRELVAFVDANPGYALLVASSMGQAATTAERVETQLYVTDLGRFMARLGVPDGAWSRRPAMEPEVGVVVAPERVAAFRAALATLSIDGRKVESHEREKGFFAIALGHTNLKGRLEEARLGDEAVKLSELGLENVAIEDEVGSNAYHVRGGSLLIYAPGAEPDPSRAPISTCDLAPSILANYGAPVPDYMRKPPRLMS